MLTEFVVVVVVLLTGEEGEVEAGRVVYFCMHLLKSVKAF